VPLGGLGEESRQALGRLLESPTFEVLPLRSTLNHVAHLPPGATISIAASPSRELDATVDLAGQLESLGFRAVPHLAARMVRDDHQLRELLDRMGAAGIDRAFVVAGDAAQRGPFGSGLDLLRAIADGDGQLTEIGIPGYPQGHPLISDEKLARALTDKAPYASYVTTQLCFDHAAIETWISEMRRSGIDLPVHVGLAGAVQVPRLLAISARIGVTDARRFVMRHGSLLRRLLRPTGYQPDQLLGDVAPALADARADVRRLHFYTFNQVAPTERWRKRHLARLA
jgi:methylenetetrahydrofolate reductase (NADPH)